MNLLKTLFSSNPDKHERKGDAFFDRAVWGVAKIEYEKALDAWEGSQAHHPRGMGDRLRKKLQQAEAALAEAHCQRGEDLMEGEYFDEARNYFDLALALTKDPALIASLRERLAEIARLTTGDDGRDISAPPLSPLADTQGDVPPGDDETFAALLGALPDALQAAYAAYGATFRSGYLALNRGEFDRALSDLSRAMDEHPAPDSFIPLELATACLNVGKLEKARELLETFLAHHPDALPGYEVLCEVYWEIGATDQADVLLDACPELLKTAPAYHLLRGETMVRAGRAKAAAAYYADALSSNGWNETVAKALADAYERMGKLEKARAVYADVMDQCTGCHSRVDPFVKRKFADISFDVGDRSATIVEIYLSLAREDAANAPFYYKRVARLCEAQGNLDEARRFHRFAQEAESTEG